MDIWNVTKSINHLIKAPYVAHPKTGRVAVPVDPDDYFRFDPRTVPSLSDLGSAKSWETLSNIRLYITRDKPLLPLVTSDPLHYKRERQAQTCDNDIEDLIDPVATTPRAAGGRMMARSRQFKRTRSPLIPELV